LTCTGLWTERRTCPRSWSRFLGVLRDEWVRFAHPDDVPLLISSRGHLLSPVRSTAWERAPHTRIGPTKTHAPPTTREGYRHPVDQGAFHRCSSGYVKGSLLFVSRAGLPLTPPTRYPHGWGQSALRGLQASPPRRARHVTSREQVTFTTRWTNVFALAFSRLGLTTQARQRGSVCVAFRAS